VPFALVVFATTATAGVNQSAEETAGFSAAQTRFQSAREASHAGNFKLAAQDYAKLMLQEPDNVDYVFGYAQVLYWSGEVSRSLRFLEQARMLAPEYEDIWELEYRALKNTASNRSRGSIDEFRQMAAEHFPNAEWHREPDHVVARKYRWDFSASREYLDNGDPDWEQINVSFGRELAERTLVTLSAGTLSRFGTTDTQFGIGVSLDVGANWTATSGIAVSSSPNFLPENAIDFRLSRRFEHGWVTGARWWRREYANVPVDSFGLVTERYFGRYRTAYALDSARLSSEQALVHTLMVNFYADSGFQLGVILAAGEEVEIVGPGQLLKTDVNSIALTGRHPVNEYLGFGWRLASHRQGRFYRRNAIGVSISGGF
jgi:YaiO family outer membrane protein